MNEGGGNGARGSREISLSYRSWRGVYKNAPNLPSRSGERFGFVLRSDGLLGFGETKR